MLSKIDISKILRDHLATLRRTDQGNGKYSQGDFTLFFYLPAIAAIVLVGYGVLLDKDSIAILLSAFAIFTGLLFNLLVLIFNQFQETEPPPVVSKENPLVDTATINERIRKAELLKQAFANVSYCIFLGILLSAACLAALSNICVVKHVASILVFYGGFNFALTLLMVLKRFHSLTERKIADA